MPDNYFDYNLQQLNSRTEFNDVDFFRYNLEQAEDRVNFFKTNYFAYKKETLKERTSSFQSKYFEENKATLKERTSSFQSDYFQYNFERLMGHSHKLKGKNASWKQIDEMNKRSAGLSWTNSIIYIFFPNGDEYWSYLPTIPDEISDSTSANWSPQTIIGSSAPVQTFIGTNSRTVKINLSLHRELASKHFPAPNTEKLIDEFLAIIRKAVYPGVMGSGGYGPAIIWMQLQEFVFINAICKSVDYTWKKPIVNGKYQVCDVSMDLEMLWPGYKGDGETVLSDKDPKNPW